MKSNRKSEQSIKATGHEVKSISLRPSPTDYATYVRTTSKVLGVTGPASLKTRPNARFLSLVKLES